MITLGSTLWSYDWLNTLALVGIAAILVVAYVARIAIKGRPHYDRVERQGGSALLSKGVMEMAYWSLQPFARLLVFFHVTPNGLSWASLVFGLFAGTCLAFGHFGFAAGFATVSGFLDSLDGMVARLSGVASDAGEVLDATVDRYVEFFFLSGLIIYYRDIPTLQILSLLAMMGSFMVSYSTAKAEALQVQPPKGAMRRPERALYLTLGAALSPVTIPWMETDRIYGIAIGYPMIAAVALVAVVANVSTVERMWAIAKAIRVRERLAAMNRVAEQKLVSPEAEAHPPSDPAPANSRIK